MLKNISSLSKSLKNAKSFSTASSRLQQIRNHPPLTQYKNLQPKNKQHLKTSVRLHKDPSTGIRFLIEQGGFPGCADLGICLKLGTQDQTAQQSGSINYLKNFVHMKPTMQELIANYEFLQQTGSFFDFNYDTICSYAKCSFLEDDKAVMTDLLLDLVLQEKNMFEDNYQTQEYLSNINELVKRTAFGGKGVGMPFQGSGNILTNSHFHSFQQKIVPANMLISMANIQNADNLIKQISDKIKSRYPKFLTRKTPPKVQSTYTGGLGIYHPDEPQFFTFAVAFPSVPFKSPEMELYNILRVIMGTASSFSSGGPGKGMHSRCTKYLLNKVACVESASFINDHFQDHGLFGLTVSGPHDTYRDIIKCTLSQMTKLKLKIQQQQLNRAKNILISSLYTNTERQGDRLQQMSRHIFSYGSVRLYEFQEKIRKVTAEQIQKTMVKLMKEKPTFVYSGLPRETELAPKYEQIIDMAYFGS